MSVTYVYAFAAFVSLSPSVSQANNTTLTDEIGVAGLVGLELVEVLPGSSTVEITFTAAIVLGTLDAVVAAHTGLDGAGNPPLPDAYIQPSQRREEQYTPTLGQITYILPSAPSADKPVDFLVNGQDSTQSDDFVVSGTTVTWLNTHFSMEIDDDVIIKYWEEP